MGAIRRDGGAHSDQARDGQDMENGSVGLLGEGSFVAGYLRSFADSRHRWIAFSRDVEAMSPPPERIESWISFIPMTALPQRLEKIGRYGPRRIVALSSTSLFTKTASPDQAETHYAKELADAERALIEWASAKGVGWTILRPTLIYGGGQDRNVSEIARFIRRFGFFPVLGAATGLRQPVHAQDVASACRQVLDCMASMNKAYNISGGETLSYRAMVERIFEAAGKPARVMAIPAWSFSAAVSCVRLLPRFRDWSTAMPRRMNQDMTFDHSEAARDFGFRPRPFHPGAADLPAS
jgi:nucleoside-diphosphate-sugar epimerase